jgi:hypothetical protein
MKGLMQTTGLAAVAIASLFGTSAIAADLGGNCCADLEERIAELEATTVRKGNRKVSLTVSGHVNEAVLWWDDDFEDNVYVVTNLVSQTRFRFVGEAKIDGDWSAGYLLELGVAASRSDGVDQTTDDQGAAVSVRHSAWWLGSKTYGKLWVGQTSTATDGITEINLANVTHFATENAAGQSGAFFARFPDGGFGPRLNFFMGGASLPASAGTDSGQIGEGNRMNVVKYESPTYMGFTFSTAWGEDDVWDAALRYAGEFNGIKVAFGIGYQRYTDGTPNERNCVEGDDLNDIHCEQLGLSGAVMHVPTGIYVHGAFGWRQDDEVDDLFPGFDDDSTQFYIQAGIEQKWIPLGKTTIFGEYQRWDIGLTQAGVELGFASAEMDMWGIGLNQNIEAAAMDLYLSIRQYEPEATDVIGDIEFEDFTTVMGGGIIKF